MTRLALLVSVSTLALAGCKSPDPPGAYGVNVTVVSSPLAADLRARAASATLTSSGDDPSPFSTAVDIARFVMAGSDARFQYHPQIMSGSITLHADVLDAGGSIIATGDSGTIVLTTGKSSGATITLAALGGGTLTQGSACQSSSECATAGGCVDGFCCDTSCKDSCTACNVAGLEGTCSPVPDGVAPPNGHPACGPDDPSTCKRDGKCNGLGGCRAYPAGTVCKPGSCNSSNNIFSPPSTCDGLGTCGTPQPRTCDPYVCKSTTECWDTCAPGDNHCSSGNTCTNSSCGLKQNGASCTMGTECQSGKCIENVCCNMDCAGPCKSCAQAASVGTCTNLPDTTVCANAACTGNMGTQKALCSSGVCPTAAVISCGAYNCYLGGGQALCYSACAVCSNALTLQCQASTNSKACASGHSCQPNGASCGTSGNCPATIVGVCL